MIRQRLWAQGQSQAGLDKLAKGDMPEGANIPKVIVGAYKDGVLAVGVVSRSDRRSSEGDYWSINGRDRQRNLSVVRYESGGNENKAYDCLGTGAAMVTGGLAPGHGVWQNVGIVAGGAVFTGGADTSVVSSTAAGAWLGGQFGEMASGIVNPVIEKELPGSMMLEVLSLHQLQEIALLKILYPAVTVNTQKYKNPGDNIG